MKIDNADMYMYNVSIIVQFLVSVIFFALVLSVKFKFTHSTSLLAFLMLVIIHQLFSHWYVIIQNEISESEMVSDMIK